MKITKNKLTDSEKKQLAIGRTGEHDVNVIEIDLSHYIDLYGEVTASAIISESVYKNGYPVLSNQDGAVLKIPVSDALTMYPQSYLEIRMITADGLAKSEIIRLICKNALPDATGEAPEAVADWIEKAEKLLKDLAESGVDPSVIEKALADYLEENPIESLTEDDVTRLLTAYITAHREELKGDKGDKGDTGERGADGLNGRDGADGQDYVLTDQDKQDIANLVPTHEPVTDDHINSLIDAKLTPIESLVDEISEVVG